MRRPEPALGAHFPPPEAGASAVARAALRWSLPVYLKHPGKSGRGGVFLRPGDSYPAWQLSLGPPEPGTRQARIHALLAA